MQVKVINKSNNSLPKYETENSAGLDLRAALNRMEYLGNREVKFGVNTKTIFVDSSKSKSIVMQIEIAPGGRCLIPTGLFIELPKGYEAQIRPRSGLALKQGITVLNSPGTIDADYRDGIGIVLINLSDKPVVINQGERIGQLVLNKVDQIEWNQVTDLDETDRKGGFGHTGTN